MYLPVFISVDTTDHTSEMPLFTEIKEKNIRPASTDDSSSHTFLWDI